MKTVNDNLFFIVRDAEGTEALKHRDMMAARQAADELGVGASIEIIGAVIYVVTEESLNPDYELFND